MSLKTSPVAKPQVNAPGPASGWLEAMDGVAYLVDRGGEICAIGVTRWDAFAEENDASRLAASRVLGSDLFAQIGSAPIRQSYLARHHAVLEGETPIVSFEFRCDAPDLRRTMRMSISRLELEGQAAKVLYQSQVLSVVSRPWISLFEPGRILEHIAAEHDVPIVRMCGFCQKIAWPPTADVAPSAWVEAEDYYRLGGPSDVRISHALCGECAASEA